MPRRAIRRPVRPPASRQLPRAIPLPENGNGHGGGSWPLQPEPASPARPVPRVEPLPDELTRPFPLSAETSSRPQRDTLVALADELSTRSTPPRNRPMLSRVAPDDAQPEQRNESPRAPARSACGATHRTAARSARRAARRTEAGAAQTDGPARRRADSRAVAGASDRPDCRDRDSVDAGSEFARHGATPRSRLAQAGGRGRPHPAAARPRERGSRPRPSRLRRACHAPRRAEPPRGEAKPNQGKTTLYDNLEQEMASSVGPSDETLTLAARGRRVRFTTVAVSVAALLFSATPLAAQDISINFGQNGAAGGGLNERIIQLIALMTVLSLAPSILVMMTSFTRIVVVLSLLRTALGTATAPPNSVVISLALFLTAFVMGPVFTNVYNTGVKPLVANQITVDQAFERASVPLRAFMEKNVREKDLQLFVNVSGEKAPDKPEDLSMRVLVPAFMISELKRAFEIGFLLFLPFLIIDLVVASVLMSMGMMMLPPVVVSLPFKLIFFVLVDGWTLVAGSLIQSYGS